MSWHDKKLEPLKVGDRVWSQVSNLEGEVVYIIKKDYYDNVSRVAINVGDIFVTTCLDNGRVPDLPDGYSFYVYERDGKPYPAHVEVGKTYIDEDGVEVLITKKEVLYNGIRNRVNGFYTPEGVSLSTGKEIIKKKD